MWETIGGLLLGFGIAILIIILGASRTVKKNDTRFENVRKFRDELLTLTMEYNKRHPEEKDVSAYTWFWGTLPDFHTMYDDVKPLTLQSYFTEQQIKRIHS